MFPLSQSTSNSNNCCTRCGGIISSINLTDDYKSKTRTESDSTEVSSVSENLTDVILCESCASDSGFISCTNSGISISSTRSEDPLTTNSTTLDSTILSSVYSTDSGIDLHVHEKFSKLSIQLEDSTARSESVDYKPCLDCEIELAHQTIQNTNPHPLLAFSQDDDGDTYLHLAIIHEVMEVVSSLINKAPNPDFLDILNHMCQSPLHLAVLTKQPVVVKKLIAAGATLTIRDRKGNTPLHITSANGDAECAKELLTPLLQSSSKLKLAKQHRRQNLEIRNYEGQMCVHLATMAGRMNILELLHKCGADFNAQEGKSGDTPLYMAVKAQNISIIRFLIEKCNVDINAPNFAGISPVQLAYFVNPDILELLLDLGAYHEDPPMTEDESESDCEMSDLTDESYKKMSYTETAGC